MLRTYWTCNSTIEFSNYEFNNKLLGYVTFLRVILDVIWTQPYIYIYIINVQVYNGICVILLIALTPIQRATKVIDKYRFFLGGNINRYWLIKKHNCVH